MAKKIGVKPKSTPTKRGVAKTTAAKSRIQKTADAVNKKNVHDYILQAKHQDVRKASGEASVEVKRPKKVTPNTKPTLKKASTRLVTATPKTTSTRLIAKKKKPL